jgi:hypothetical protein
MPSSKSPAKAGKFSNANSSPAVIGPAIAIGIEKRIICSPFIQPNPSRSMPLMRLLGVSTPICFYPAAYRLNCDAKTNKSVAVTECAILTRSASKIHCPILAVLFCLVLWQEEIFASSTFEAKGR